MNDPASTAAAATATKEIVSAAGAVAKTVGKEIDGYFGLVLKPVLKTIGIELNECVKERIADWKEKRRRQNIEEHTRRAARILEDEKREPSTHHPRRATIQQIETFESWAEGAGEIDPDEPYLATMWQRLFIDLELGFDVQAALIEKLKLITPSEARLLLKFKDKHAIKARGAEERHYFKSLEKKEIIVRNTARLVKHCSILASIPLVGVVTERVQPALAAYHIHFFGMAAQYDLNASLIISAIMWTLFGGVFLGIVQQISFGLYPDYNLTWLGSRLLRYAPPAPSKSP